MAAGRVIRFDGMRGYGFIAPEHGGEDVFMHVNDLLIPESAVRAGLMVEFEIEDGDRGLKASEVRLASEAEGLTGVPPVPRTPVAPAPFTEGQEPMCDVLSSAEYLREVTELLLTAAPDMTGHQIKAVRKQFALLGTRHGWIED
ncbi:MULTISPECIES: cold shock domain-containing protein [unclassified Streptomyces]|uniref:cold-shock protein n=1 Tax=unclassified Streptomyces TaxID=2593676 RepID=UPI0001C19065|nr:MULTISPECIES: cold shock domain-containing protein [unclassified Streptomyces]AEN08795.1 cold-shock DNA-binding domain protein [Streptomyces sp. SirexAA-E]MYR68708.1 cold shock domain-containing protein [Streptomyces sp. SID4939]MYS03000.1 cold shock domain-containing protein [Streptomyces sp. SID4940]MYT64116.1 cold shock domain-containing protein [Streptomyces sp. SID8357]MYT86899.1 cold shock domain-containing protein [Streptomyces sp. SID8360]